MRVYFLHFHVGNGYGSLAYSHPNILPSCPFGVMEEEKFPLLRYKGIPEGFKRKLASFQALVLAFSFRGNLTLLGNN